MRFAAIHAGIYTQPGMHCTVTWGWIAENG